MKRKLLSAIIKSHSLIAELLSFNQILSLAKAQRLETFVQILSETSHPKIMVKINVTGSDLEKALHLAFIKRITSMLKIIPTNLAEFIQTYYFKYEILNLKRIIQGKFNKISTTQIIESLLPIESDETFNLTNLNKLQSVDDVITNLTSTRSTRFIIRSKYYELYHRYGEIWPLELSLNQGYATILRNAIHNLPQQARAFVNKIIGVEIDVENLLFAFKQKTIFNKIKYSYELNDLFPVRYRLRLEHIQEAIESEDIDIKSFIDTLPPPYTHILSPIYQGNELLIIKQLRQYIYDEARHQRLLNDYGHNVILASMIYSEIERNNLVGIAWGIAQNTPLDDILRSIVPPYNIV
jgi:vacuolar-type H+-ATPase subunit C/Vma6